jgi:adhesin transport system outer membrane protein
MMLMMACSSLSSVSYADDGFNLVIGSPANGTDNVIVYNSDAGPVIAAEPEQQPAVSANQDALPAPVAETVSPVLSMPAPEVVPEAASVAAEPVAAPVVASDLEIQKSEIPVVQQAPIPEPEVVTKAPEVVLTAQPTAPEAIEAKTPVVQGETDEVSAAWQAHFIRSLTGNDGVLSLDLQPAGQDDRLQESVRLDEAVSIALQNNNELKASIAGAKSKEWDTMGTYSQYLPTVNLDVAVGREQSRPASYNDSNGDRVLDNTHLRRDRSLLVRQPIIDLGVIADIFLAKSKQDIGDIDKLETRDTVALGTVTAYLKLLQSQVAIQLADQYRVYLDGLAKIMQTRVDAGGATAADLDRVISRSTLAESARMEAVGEFEINLAEFKRLTGVMPMKIVVPTRLAPDIPVDMADASKRAYINNPSYLGSVKKVDLAQDERHKTYSTVLPKVYAQYSGVYSYNAGGSANANPVDGVYATQRTDTAMIVAQWSLNGLTPIAGSLSAAAKEKQSYLQSLDVRQRMDQAIRANYTAVSSTKKRLAVLQKTVEANERVVTGFEAQYKSGTRSLFDLLDAYEQLYNSRLNLTRVIFSYTLASFQIRQQMGDIVPSIVDIRG